ncbi:helix-turn-helix domain-containing protein [Fictibacillus phosphorivorans]|uniref:helix-turn-helix domain-containing protein n=1 Tax=Fictibacillus phosphorivorans TaxID=1221500 RepID=UPI0035E53766
MNLREEYLLKRRRKGITMNKLAAYVGCSQSLISRYETHNCGMSKTKLERYREFIDQYESKI